MTEGTGGRAGGGGGPLDDPRLRWGLFGGVVVFAVMVVVSVSNPVPHSGGDNAGYVALAHGLLTQGSYADVFDPEGLPHTKYPPVFPGLLALLIAAGARTWAALKTTAAVSTVAAVAFTYLWAGRTLNPLGAFAVALLTALSVGVVYYSQWVLSDPLFLALTFAALYALARAEGSRRGAGSGKDGSGGSAGSAAGGPAAEGPAGSRTGGGIDGRWLAVGVVGAGLAYFTRSAGLPLVVAVLGWLAVRRAWKSLAAAGVVVGVPMLGWFLRGRLGGVGQYASEFWMVNPYDPSLGTVGIPGLFGRVVENLVGYATRHLPLGVVGADAPAVPLVGIALTVAAFVGWGVRVRRRVGPAELFFPLYWGVVLLWPPVWSGDRFALPLLPLIFVYGAVALRQATRRLPEAIGPTLATIAVLLLLVPAADDWRRAMGDASACPEEVVAQSVWACYGPRVQSFMVAATWAGEGLPEGSAVLSRKPRHFYLQSGIPSRAFAFFEDPAVHLRLADDLGARYVLLDRWDGFATRYVGAAVRGRPGAFCYVQGFGRPESGAQLLGILPPDDRAAASGEVARCPSSYVTGRQPAEERYSSSGIIPLLEGLDS